MRADVRRQVERNREFIQDRLDGDAEREYERKRHMATTRKTAYGDRVPKWPSTEPVWDRIERLDEALRDLYDDAAQRARADEAISKTTTPTSARFPALGG